jgi:hypothetical protein
MKITINIDCTPAEARQFMGLPDVAPMQEEMLRELRDRMMSNIGSLHPSELVKTWFPMGLDSWLALQKEFWGQLTSIGRQSDEKG